MGGHPLELPPAHPCSQGTPIVFAVPLDCSWFGDSSRGNSVLCSLSNALQFDMDSGTKTAGSSLFSHGLKIAVVFCRFSRMSFLPGGSLPAFRPRWCAGCATSPGDISHSDGHSIFKVQVLLQEQFSEKIRPFPYIQEVGKERKTGWISTLRDRKKEGYAMQVKLIIQERLKDLRVEPGA